MTAVLLYCILAIYMSWFTAVRRLPPCLIKTNT